MFIRIVLVTFLFAMGVSAQNVEMPPEGALVPGVSRELAKWRAERYSDVLYKLDLTLEKMSPVLRGTVEIRVVVAAEANLRKGAQRVFLSSFI